jgi:CsoR family transcriptional regulator, copper-sensing transcriptional repressor
LASYCCDKPAILEQLRLIEDQVRQVEKMMGDGTYCVEVLNRLADINNAAQEVGMVILEDHIKGCVSDALVSGNRPAAVKELVEVLERFM